MESLLDIKTNQNIDSRIIPVVFLGKQADEVFIDLKSRNTKVVKSVELVETGLIEKKILAITGVINRDTFFTGENLTVELVIANGTSKKYLDHLYIDLIKTVEYIYDKKSMIGRIQKYESRWESVMQYVVKRKIVPMKRVEFIRDFEIPLNLYESTLSKDAIIRQSYSLRVTIPEHSECLEFPIYIVNSLGTKMKRQFVSLSGSFKQPRKCESVDDFELIDDDVGFLDQNVKTPTRLNKSDIKFDNEVEEISQLLKDD